MTTIVFSCLITEVINHTDTISLRNMENAIDIMKDSNMEDCLDQLILVGSPTRCQCYQHK